MMGSSIHFRMIFNYFTSKNLCLPFVTPSITGWTLECQITKWHNISSSIAQNEEASGGETHQSPVEMPKVTRRLLPARRLRKRAMAVEDRDSGEFTLMDFVFWFIPDVFFSAHQLENNLVSFSALDLAFQTPARPVMRPKHVLSEIDRMTPRNTTARNIYSPIVRFVTPSKESAYSSCLLSLHHCVFNNAWQKKKHSKTQATLDSVLLTSSPDDMSNTFWSKNILWNNLL